MTLHVFTARMGYRADADWLDVSLQGNMRRAEKGEEGGHRRIGLFFAPSPDLLYPYLSKRKFGRLTDRDWDDYRDGYTAEMRRSYVRFSRAWDVLLSWERVVLLCMCTDPKECHRTVLAEILEKLGATRGGEISVERRAKA